MPVDERLADPHEVGALDQSFHATLVSAAGNGATAKVHQDMTECIRTMRCLDFTRPDRIDATCREHGKILRTIIQRKLEVAQLLLRSHIEQSKIEERKISPHAMHEAGQRAGA